MRAFPTRSPFGGPAGPAGPVESDGRDGSAVPDGSSAWAPSGPFAQARPAAPAAAFKAALAALFVLLVFDAPGIAAWAEALPPSPATDLLSDSAAAWRDGLARAGLDEPWRLLRKAGAAMSPEPPVR